MTVCPFPCPAETLRGQLKHSWLENQVRDITTDDIVSFWKDSEWSDTVEEIFPHNLRQTLELADGLAEGFSPAQLVDQLGPLRDLSDYQRMQLKKAVHESYLETSNITALEAPIRQCALALLPLLNDLRKTWKEPFTAERAGELRNCWEEIRIKGMALHEQLEKLPRGVILP